MTRPFDCYVVLDFEATCDNGPGREPQEIIEYPSLLLDGQDLRALDEFQSFVRPRHHPELTPFCMELTGITQDQVDAAPPFPDVYRAHRQWLARHGLDVDCDGSGRSFAFVLCGDWDLKTMLPEQCRACDPPIASVPESFRRWVNIKTPFATCLRLRKSPGLAGMLRKLDMDFVGRHHRGIDDCRNIARIARHLADNGTELSLTMTPRGPVRAGRRR